MQAGLVLSVFISVRKNLPEIFQIFRAMACLSWYDRYHPEPPFLPSVTTPSASAQFGAELCPIFICTIFSKGFNAEIKRFQPIRLVRSNAGEDGELPKDIDLEQLTDVIKGVEKYLKDKTKALAPEKKARLISLLYGHFAKTGEDVDLKTVVSYLKLVA